MTESDTFGKSGEAFRSNASGYTFLRSLRSVCGTAMNLTPGSPALFMSSFCVAVPG